MSTEKALLGAGCFWGVDLILRKIPGILKTEVGYAGGTTKNPTYEEVCTGKTDHAEVVLVTFNSQEISYAQVLDVFFRLHDPTTMNRQHNDIGSQYRSVIFTYSDEQRATALETVKKINDSHVFKNPIVTQVLTVPDFFTAEAYHQNYLIKNPSGYMCHILRD
ncbi:MAG: peptide-methionine (S)-S-oxide reductase MsrA [Bacteriovorax sp.]|nr:peptide-methionine (S)-S-oxide reductase MsrA [Bacteriovorax sp.]